MQKGGANPLTKEEVIMAISKSQEITKELREHLQKN